MNGCTWFESPLAIIVNAKERRLLPPPKKRIQADTTTKKEKWDVSFFFFKLVFQKLPVMLCVGQSGEGLKYPPTDAYWSTVPNPTPQPLLPPSSEDLPADDVKRVAEIMRKIYIYLAGNRWADIRACRRWRTCVLDLFTSILMFYPSIFFSFFRPYFKSIIIKIFCASQARYIIIYMYENKIKIIIINILLQTARHHYIMQQRAVPAINKNTQIPSWNHGILEYQ